MSAYFISAIGTGIGKTFVTCALAHQLKQAGHAVAAYKPIISGYDESTPRESDTWQIARSLGHQDESAETIQTISPWRFKAPLSPHMAAKMEGKAINPEALMDWSMKAQNSADTVLIEGVGGLMVPLHEQFTVLDWIQAMRWPVVLVAANYLGAINHTLLSLSALEERGIRLQSLILTENIPSEVPLKETEATLRDFLPSEAPIITVPHLGCGDEHWRKATEIWHTALDVRENVQLGAKTARTKVSASS